MNEKLNVVEKQKLEAQMVKDMMVSDGWKIIERDFIENSKELTNDLLEAEDIVEVHRLQAMIKARKNFFDIIANYYSIST